MLAVGADGGCLDIFFSSIISPLSPSLLERGRYRLKYYLKGPLSPKQPNNLSSTLPSSNVDTISLSCSSNLGWCDGAG